MDECVFTRSNVFFKFASNLTSEPVSNTNLTVYVTDMAT